MLDNIAKAFSERVEPFEVIHLITDKQLESLEGVLDEYRKMRLKKERRVRMD